MIFQDPMTSLNPVLTIGEQIAEAMTTHNPGMSDEQARERTIRLLEVVGVPFADRRVHPVSARVLRRHAPASDDGNGDRERPDVLIADEPTTALDVTIQAQIVEVMRAAQEETHAATILITHDLGLIAELADRVVVMYAGRVVELSDVFTIFNSPRHPYTIGLMSSLARLDVGPGSAPPHSRTTPEPPDASAGMRVSSPLHPLPGTGALSARTFLRSGASGEGGQHLSACHFAEELVATHAGAGITHGDA